MQIVSDPKSHHLSAAWCLLRRTARRFSDCCLQCLVGDALVPERRVFAQNVGFQESNALGVRMEFSGHLIGLHRSQLSPPRSAFTDYHLELLSSKVENFSGETRECIFRTKSNLLRNVILSTLNLTWLCHLAKSLHSCCRQYRSTPLIGGTTATVQKWATLSRVPDVFATCQLELHTSNDARAVARRRLYASPFHSCESVQAHTHSGIEAGVAVCMQINGRLGGSQHRHGRFPYATSYT